MAPQAPEEPAKPFIITARQWLRDYFFSEEINFSIALVPMCFLSMLLFTRHPLKTNFIFDEQEALLANPYVRSIADAKPKFRWVDAFFRDFWGLPPDRSIGSYRPIPDLVWRALWGLGARDQTPFLHHWVNVLFHGINGALMAVLAMRITKDRTTAWLAGAAFTSAGVLTEAVSGVVGLSDVLGGMGALFALLALTLPKKWMPLGVFAGTLFGLYSKESALCCVPLVPVFALATADALHTGRPQRFQRAALSLVAAGAAFVLYVELRRRMFPAPLPAELSVEALAGKPKSARIFGGILRWYAQPSLPKDPLNNPLVGSDAPIRVAGALRVYVRGLWQVVCPWTLSGDYSAPQEPRPSSIWEPEGVIGGLFMLIPIVTAPFLLFAGYRHHKRLALAPGQPLTAQTLDVRPIVAAAMVWVVVSYFPVSNIPVLLPTVRAERFWYFPAVGTSFLVAFSLKALLDEWRGGRRLRIASLAIVTLFFVQQGIGARKHANDYTDDLAFWDATRKAVPRSAKAHLNYSVMKGARGDLEARLAANRVALELAPQWPMASIYLGDTLCRLHRAPESIEHYKRGFALGPNDVNLIALGLQCLWDENQIKPSSDTNVRKELETLGEQHIGSWLDWLMKDIIANGETNNGVDPKHRPRGYNEGPKD